MPPGHNELPNTKMSTQVFKTLKVMGYNAVDQPTATAVDR